MSLHYSPNFCNSCDLKVRAEFRRILMEMGFEEMPTNKWVESSFWNFDALFQPQSHPARDAHDTFFMKEPMFANSVPEEYYEVRIILKKTLSFCYQNTVISPFLLELFSLSYWEDMRIFLTLCDFCWLPLCYMTLSKISSLTAL